MSDLFFNHGGKTRTLRVLPVDEKPNGVTVWEAMVDSDSYTYFEAAHGAEIWELFGLAVDAYLEYRVDETITTIKWKAD